MEYTVTMRALGAERTVTWRDGMLHGDAVMIERFRADAAAIPAILVAVPVGYTPEEPWEGDPEAALAILATLGQVVSVTGFPEQAEIPDGVVI